MTRRSDELLAAYVDGVSEISSAEREGIEARLRDDGELRAEEMATRNLLDQLRALGTAERERAEPALDWAAMERSIRDAVGPEVPRPWWRRLASESAARASRSDGRETRPNERAENDGPAAEKRTSGRFFGRWRWLVPGMATLAVATAILVVVVRTPSVELGELPVVPHGTRNHDASVALASDREQPALGDEHAVVWLDGMDVELGPEADAVLDDLEAKQLRGVGDQGVELVVSDLRWVDDLDDADLDGIERALEREAARRKKG